MVIQVAQVFKNSRPGFRLGKLIAHLLKGDTLGKDAGRYPAHAVRVHGFIGDAGLRGAGLAVAFDYRVNFSALGAGQLCFFRFLLEFLCWTIAFTSCSI